MATTVKTGMKTAAVLKQKKTVLRDTIAKEVYTRRNARGWTQPTLATKAGVTQARVSEVENAARDYRIDTAERILKALGCKLMVVGN